MKNQIEELNQIHKRISELRVKINELEKDAGSGNENLNKIINGRIEDLVEEYKALIERLKDVIKD